MKFLRIQLFSNQRSLVFFGQRFLTVHKSVFLFHQIIVPESPRYGSSRSVNSCHSLGLITCGGEVLVIGPHFLGHSAQGYLLLDLREDEGQEEVLEDKDEEEEESEVDEKVKEVRENAQLMHATW